MAQTRFDLQLGNGGPPRRPGRGGGRLGVVLPWIFCLPFVAFGLFVAGQGVSRISTGDDEQGPLLLLFGVVFAGLPVAALAWRQGKRKDARQAPHSDAPWLLNKAWATGRISCSNRAGMIVSWVFSLMWNGISWPLLIPLAGEIEGGNPAIFLTLLFPLVGLALLVWALRTTLRWRRFGASHFELASLPGVLGGELSGTLRVGEGLAGAQQFQASLSCIRRYVTGAGKSRSTHEDILWAEEAQPAGSALLRGPHGLALPLRFTLPYDCKPSDPIPSNDRILWRLEVRAALPGVDYHAQFEVPVFETSKSDPTRTAAALAKERGGAAEAPAGQLASRITVRPVPEGGTEIVFPAGRHLGPALLTTLFGGVFGGVTWVCHAQGAPSFFTLAFGAATALIAYGALSLGLGSTRLRVRRHGVCVENRLLFLRSRKNVPARAIETVDLEVGMRVGSRVYWDLRLRSKAKARASSKRGGGIRIASRIGERNEAERLVALVCRELGR